MSPLSALRSRIVNGAVKVLGVTVVPPRLDGCLLDAVGKIKGAKTNPMGTPHQAVLLLNAGLKWLLAEGASTPTEAAHISGQFFSEMRRSDINPNRVTYELLIKHHGSCGGHSFAESLLGAMQRDKISVADTTIVALLHGRKGVEEAEKVLKKYLELSEVKSHPADILTKCLELCNNSAEVLYCVTFSKEFRLRTDDIFWVAVLQRLCDFEAPGAGWTVWSQLKLDGLATPKITICLLHTFVLHLRRGQSSPKEVSVLTTRAEEAAMHENDTDIVRIEILMHIHFLAGQRDQAKRLWDISREALALPTSPALSRYYTMANNPSIHQDALPAALRIVDYQNGGGEGNQNEGKKEEGAAEGAAVRIPPPPSQGRSRRRGGHAFSTF